MTAALWTALAPALIFTGASIVVLLAGAWGVRRTALSLLAAAGLAAGAAVATGLAMAGHQAASPLLDLDPFAQLATAVLAGVGLAVLALFHVPGDERARDAEIPPALILLSTVGMVALVSARHFATLLLGLELLTVSLYPLIATRRDDPVALEAAIKYLVLASLASGLLLLGGALLYAATGTLDLKLAAGAVTRTGLGPLGAAGAALLLAGFGFKLALVPFHRWAPDVYQGAAPPAAAFLAAGSKGAMLLALVRLVAPAAPLDGTAAFDTLYALAVLTMTAGNLLALFQTDLRRLLACSSIAHAGYLVVAPLALGQGGAAAAGFYVAAYSLATIAAFGVLAVLAHAEGRDAFRLRDLQGMAARRPWLAVVLVLAVLSLAGIPLTAGFVGKVVLFGAAVKRGLFVLAAIALLNSGVSLYYYLRVVVAVTMRRTPEREGPVPVPLPLAGAWALGLLSLGTIVLGVAPWAVLDLFLRTAALIAGAD